MLARTSGASPARSISWRKSAMMSSASEVYFASRARSGSISSRSSGVMPSMPSRISRTSSSSLDTCCAYASGPWPSLAFSAFETAPLVMRPDVAPSTGGMSRQSMPAASARPRSCCEILGTSGVSSGSASSAGAGFVAIASWNACVSRATSALALMSAMLFRVSLPSRPTGILPAAKSAANMSSVY